MFVIKISKRSSRFTHTWVKPAGFDTGIKVYNCTAKSKVPLIIKNKNFITWYTCGPTVYDSAHIGHASTYVKLDVIQRILKNYFKIDVITAMNITDIDDKIINRSRERNVEVLELAKEYEKEFWEDMHSLKVTKPNIILRVTENIECIKDFIKQLKQNNVAYTTNKGGVYFNIQSAYNYGKLQNLGTNNLECSDQGEKKNVVDFALWKETKDGEPAWQSDWGPGRPGWHTECSALATSVFGR